MPPKRGKGRGRGAGRGQDQQQPQRPGREEQQPQRPPPGREEQQQRPSRQEPPPDYGQPRQRPPPGHREQQPPAGHGMQHLPSPSDHRPEQLPLAHGGGDGDAQPPQAKSTKRKEMKISPEALGLYLEQSLTLRAPLQPRPGHGQRGRKIGLIVNYFSVELPHGYVYHYDVEVTPKRRDPEKSAAEGPKLSEKKYRCLSTKRNREVISAMLQKCAHFRGQKPAYDGQKNLYTKKPLDAAPFTVDVEVDDEPQVARRGEPQAAQAEVPPRRTDIFEVSVKPVQKKETNSCAISLDPLHALFQGKINEVPQEAVMAVETILRNGPCFRYVPVGRSFFYPPMSPEDMHPLSGGREIWYGYHQSLRLAQWKPMVNINVTATTFYKHGPVIDYVSDILGCSTDDLFRIPQLKDSDIVLLSKELKDLRIKVTHLNYARKYRIVKLTREAANRVDFPIEVNGRTVRKRVSDYFLEQYQRRLQYPQLPCLQVGPESKKVYLPLEVCEILEGQHCKKKMTESQTSEMIKKTARPPVERFREIQQIVRRADFNNDPYNREFGIRVSTDPLQLDGRVIDPPNVRYNNDRRIMPRDGSWDMRDKQFFRGAEITSWVLLSYANERFCNRQALNKFSDMLCSIGRESGITLGRPDAVEIFGDRNVRVDATLQRVLRNIQGVTLAVIVLPDRNAVIYGEVKQAAEKELGLVTQCVKAFNVTRKCNPPLISNLCQKINAKMGGVNNSLSPGETPEILKKPVIIIGADVTHPSPGSGLRPSIAAAVGSLDAHPSRYAVTCRVQKHTDEKKKAIEIIQDLKNMVVELLKAFYKNTRGRKPEKIIFYRDGVSEGQFAEVRDYEIKAVREACKKLDAEYEPGITFVVVQKRHHTRFMPRDHRDGVGRMKNIPPGTTVDRDVTSSINFDFFLCSHFGIQGTSRPSHYTVLSDDNQFTSDDMQKLTYYLCHTYARCTKSISVPAPVAYAHLAAFRARQHLITQVDESSASSQTSGGTQQELPSTWKEAIVIRPNLRDTMYFV